MRVFLLLFSLVFFLSSCIEVIDDITIHSDGSGTFKYSVNLSSSKTKITSILSLDSLDGYKVPEKSEIEQKILDFKYNLSLQKGIKNVKVEYNFQDYIFKVSFDFDNVDNLQTGLKSAFTKVTGKTIYSESVWLEWSENKLSRNIPDITTDRLLNSKWLDLDLLESGTYTSISRFDNIVETFSNQFSKLSKSQTAIMTQVKTNELFLNTSILINKISVKSK